MELPTQESSELNIQVFAQHLDTRAFGTSVAFDVKKVMVIDLSKAYGFSKEPDFISFSKLIKSMDNDYFEGDLNSNDIFKAIGRESQIPVASYKKASVPVNPNLFDASVTNLFSYNRQNVYDTQGNVSWQGKDDDLYWLKLVPSGAESQATSLVRTKVLGSGIPIENITYIEAYLWVKDETNLTNIGVNLMHSDGSVSYSPNQVDQARRQATQSIRIRIPLRKFTNVSQGKVVTGVTVTASGIGFEVHVKKIDCVKGSKGAVYLYFDDATIGHYQTAFPIMERYGLKGTIAVPTERVGENVGVSGQRVKWSQLRALQDAGWLVVSHGLDEKSLAEQMSEEAERQIKKSAEMLFDRGFVFGSKCLVAPQGSWSIDVDKIARKYVSFVRTWQYENSDLTMEFPNSYSRNQNYTGPHLPLSEVKSKIDLAIERKEEIALAFHLISEDNSWGVNFWNSTSDFEEICSYIRDKIDEGLLECVTWKDVYLQSKDITSLDTLGHTYLVSVGQDLTVVKLPIEE